MGGKRREGVGVGRRWEEEERESAGRRGRERLVIKCLAVFLLTQQTVDYLEHVSTIGSPLCCLLANQI